VPSTLMLAKSQAFSLAVCCALDMMQNSASSCSGIVLVGQPAGIC
jgi:hypothetical protein